MELLSSNVNKSSWLIPIPLTDARTLEKLVIELLMWHSVTDNKSNIMIMKTM